MSPNDRRSTVHIDESNFEFVVSSANRQPPVAIDFDFDGDLFFSDVCWALLFCEDVDEDDDVFEDDLDSDDEGVLEPKVSCGIEEVK